MVFFRRIWQGIDTLHILARNWRLWFWSLLYTLVVQTVLDANATLTDIEHFDLEKIRSKISHFFCKGTSYQNFFVFQQVQNISLYWTNFMFPIPLSDLAFKYTAFVRTLWAGNPMRSMTARLTLICLILLRSSWWAVMFAGCAISWQFAAAEGLSFPHACQARSKGIDASLYLILCWDISKALLLFRVEVWMYIKKHKGSKT